MNNYENFRTKPKAQNSRFATRFRITLTTLSVIFFGRQKILAQRFFENVHILYCGEAEIVVAFRCRRQSEDSKI